MNLVFLDTGYLIALEAVDDQYHQAVKQHWQNLLKSLPQLITTSYVFTETVTFFNNNKCHSKAVEVGNSLLQSHSVKFIHIDETLFNDGWLYLKKHSDKSYSLTDCISFIVMNKLQIENAFTLDKHFTQAGFEVFPKI